jgi:LuxR family maltose regulon positive regulatory protein
MADAAARVVSVTAPTGYGKTTAVARFTDLADGPVVWVTAGEDCRDPIVFARYVAVALEPWCLIGSDLEHELDSVDPRLPILTAGLGAAIREMSDGLVIVIDDIQELSDASEGLVEALIENVPEGARIVIAGTHTVPLLGSLRAKGELIEIGRSDLELDLRDAERLLRGAAAADVDPDVASTIWERSEGWAAGLYLAGLALRRPEREEDLPTEPFQGDDRFVSDFVRETVLTRLPAEQVDFLVRTAVLDELSGSVCDAVLGQTGSAACIEELDRQNVFVVPLDDRRERYRYHRLFRDCLLAELTHREPEQLPVLHARASAWYEDHGAADRAIEHAISGGDADRVASLLVRYGQALYFSGRAASLDRWIEWFSDHAPIEDHPKTAVIATWFMMISGRPVDAERWEAAAAAGAARRPMDAHFEGIRLLASAAMCRHGVADMAREVGVAASLLPPASPFIPTSWIMLALTSLMSGDVSSAIEQLRHALEHSHSAGTVPATAFALSELAICSLHQSEIRAASRYVSEARDAIVGGHLEGYSANALTMAVAARVALLQGDHPRVERLMAEADVTRGKLTVAMPPLALQTRLELARCAVGLGDVRRARIYLAEADDIVRARPDLGVLTDEVRQIEQDLADRLRTSPGIAELTPAESRLLPHLTTHLSFREIGEQLFVSHHTVKTQAISIYRKLGVTSRGAAVEVARRLGLLSS